MPILPENKKAEALSKRLSAVAESLCRGGLVCDVGSDHGALPIFLLQKDFCREVIVSDVNPLPLERARAALEEAGLSDRAKFVLTDGIQSLLSYHPTSFVIAGMGGETIGGILSRAVADLSGGETFVLQPMTREEYLRRFLYENGFSVLSEKAVEENEKAFLILVAKFDGVERCRDDKFYFLGEYLPHLRDEGAKKYFEKRYAQIHIKYSGKRRAGLCAEKEKEQLDCLSALLEDFK